MCLGKIFKQQDRDPLGSQDQVQKPELLFQRKRYDSTNLLICFSNHMTGYQ
jgi:hypothetical protein